MENRYLAELVSIKRALNTYRRDWLDTHHINVDVAAVFAEAAQRLGKRVEDLTEDERKAAFLNAWIEVNEPQ